MLLIAHDDALPHRDDALVHGIDDFPVVRDHDDRRALLIHPLEQLHDLPGIPRIEVSGRLIRQQNVRMIDQRSRERHSLLLAAGELIRKVFILVGKSDRGKNVRHIPLDARIRDLNDTLGKCHVLIDIPVLQQTEVLEYDAQIPAEFCNLPMWKAVQIIAQHIDVAAGRPQLPEQKLDQG